MCSDETPARDADGNLQSTEFDSVSGAPGYCALLSKLKCTTALAAGRKRRREYLRKYSQSERGKEVIRAYERRNRKKRNAYNKLRQALKMGDLVRGTCCETCGANVRPEAHHDDYDKPLVVRWLCRQCHKTWHRKNGEAANG